MTKTYVIGDCHLGHKGICEFTKADGSKVRPWDNVDEMNKALVDNWNAVVKDKDLVYVLGDFTVNPKYIYLAGELAGRKILVKGNHDNGKLSEYAEYFEDVVACVVRSKAILTHIPVHPDQLRRFGHNIHGHLHTDQVRHWVEGETGIGMMPEWVIDTRYTCVSVEQIGYKPMLINDILEKL